MPRLNPFFIACLTVAALAGSCSWTTDASLFLSEPIQVPNESFINKSSSTTMMGASDVEKRSQIRFFTVFSLLAVTGVMVYLISQCFKAFLHDRHLGIYGTTLRRLAEGGSRSCLPQLEEAGKKIKEAGEMIDEAEEMIDEAEKRIKEAEEKIEEAEKMIEEAEDRRAQAHARAHADPPFWTDQMDFWTRQIDFWTGRIDFWTDQIKYSLSQVKFWTQRMKFWTDQMEYLVLRVEYLVTSSKLKVKRAVGTNHDNEKHESQGRLKMSKTNKS